ncbi:MAG: N(4)-(beta-N-acetylglucosaminyl)-L-asparaginase [Planctomycetes bacterium]|nr:N(4)-(beta-N-acetylglucosaminyl)-L-asparaginase [Planctomycetota bacterium]
MNVSRRQFLETTAGLAIATGLEALENQEPAKDGKPFRGGAFTPPVAVATWKFGERAATGALRILQVGGTPLDAVERGINLVEEDPQVDSVGRGGLPNEEGVVELDAGIMDGKGLRCGSVLSLRGIARPISLARKVMENTRHVYLAGDGALRFARSKGFKEEDLLTPASRKKWEEWMKLPDHRVPGQVDPEWDKNKKKPSGDADSSHDTIGLVALDVHGGMAAGCSTSGLAWKMPGRVGDSPIIGSGLYCDAEAGGASATGIGEEILRICGSFLIVERMRQGASPQQAIEEALQRLVKVNPQNRKRQVAFIALSKKGEAGAGAILPGFQVAIQSEGKALLAPAWSLEN